MSVRRIPIVYSLPVRIAKKRSRWERAMMESPVPSTPPMEKMMAEVSMQIMGRIALSQVRSMMVSTVRSRWESPVLVFQMERDTVGEDYVSAWCCMKGGRCLRMMVREREVQNEL